MSAETLTLSAELPLPSFDLALPGQLLTCFPVAQLSLHSQQPEPRAKEVLTKGGTDIVIFGKGESGFYGAHSSGSQPVGLYHPGHILDILYTIYLHYNL